MWARGAAIRPVPPYAVVDAPTLEAVEASFSSDEPSVRASLDEAFGRFEATQPTLSAHAGRILATGLDDRALALGYFLTIAIWLAFERAFGPRLGTVDALGLDAVRASLDVEEELRATRGDVAVELDDVVAREQPHVLRLVNEHVEAALEDPEPDEEITERADVEDIHAVYRMAIVVTLALSHAVTPTDGSTQRRPLFD